MPKARASNYDKSETSFLSLWSAMQAQFSSDEEYLYFQIIISGQHKGISQACLVSSIAFEGQKPHEQIEEPSTMRKPQNYLAISLISLLLGCLCIRVIKYEPDPQDARAFITFHQTTWKGPFCPELLREKASEKTDKEALAKVSVTVSVSVRADVPIYRTIELGERIGDTNLKILKYYTWIPTLLSVCS